MSSTASRGTFVFAVTLALAICGERGETHKLISSKYTYNNDIFPILRQRCGQCHRVDGVAPMSLMTFKDAFPWSESLRSELITRHMPPWNVLDNIGAFRDQPAITAGEIDQILTWATGGYPEGDPAKPPSPTVWSREWPLGRPDLLLEPPRAFTLAADVSDTIEEFTLQTHTTDTKWLRAVDLLPGTPAIVRNATISIKTNSIEAPTNSSLERETVVAVWVPGGTSATNDGTAFQLPAGAELTVRIHYRKTYTYDGKEVADRSSIGLYFAEGAPTEIRRWTLISPVVTPANNQFLTFSRVVDEDLRVLAFSPDPSLSNARLEITMVTPGGTRTPVVHLALRPNWTRRYWFEQPLDLPRGSRIEAVVIMNAADRLLPPAASPLPPQDITGTLVRAVFDVVPSTAH